MPQIEVTFDIDANGIVNVSAKDLGTGKEQHITITASSNLSKEDIDKAVREAEQFAEEDRKRKEEVDTRNAGDQMVYQAEKALEELGDKLDPNEKGQIEERLKELKTALEGSDTEQIKKATEELTKVFQTASEKMYQAAAQAQQQAGGADPAYGEDSGTDGPEVFDADYEVVDE